MNSPTAPASPIRRCRLNFIARCGCSWLAIMALTRPILAGPIQVDEEAPWPRVRSTNGNTVTLHLPQVEHWTSNSFIARAVVEVKSTKAKKEQLGVVWFDAHGSVDHSNRVVTLDRFDITRSLFPDATDKGSNALAIVREVIPAGARTVSLDYLVTALGFAEAEARQGSQGLKHDPPDIVWVTNRTTLVLIDGEPALRPIDGTSLERVINTPALILRDKADGRFYLEGDGPWYAASSIGGPWSLVQTPPSSVASFSATNSSAATKGSTEPTRILVRTRPTELLMTMGLPAYRPIPKTSLQYAANTDSQLFYLPGEHATYLLISGRWYKSSSLHGPWSHVKPGDLPDAFQKIPANSAQGIVLASVPGTRQAELSRIASSVPTTATIDRGATIEVKYEGEPRFNPIEGTAMTYAINADVPVIKSGQQFFAVKDGVWFSADAATGPWKVAVEVPEEIYTIPPSSPVYYATYVRIYDADDQTVETGYTAGYNGAYEDDGTMVYGTGYDYDPYNGSDYYYGWGWTWGYSYWYVPWYQWWVWRPWWGWSEGGRAALIENIYDRWNSPHVTPHDRDASTGRTRRTGSSGYPALYGRFQGSTRPAPLQPPADTLAINPYSRPQTPARAGDIPRGSQLLSTVRQQQVSGRDLYASPDGNVYLRKPDGWYRRQSGNNWSFAAPLQGQVERGQVASATRNGQPVANGGGYRIAPANVAGRVDRPNAGSLIPEQQVADLERQYYARSVGQMRSQQVRPNAGRARGGRRR